MQEPNDKPLHNWVRQTLQTYQPPPQPQDWMRMQKKLRKRYWWRTGFMALGTLLTGLVVVWWFYARTTGDKTVQTRLAPVEIKPQQENTSGSQVPIIAAPQPDSPAIAMEGKTDGRLVGERRFTKITILQSKPVVQLIEPLLLQKKAKAYLPQVSIPVFSPEESAIRYQMQTGKFGADSTSYRVFSRNISRWPDAVVVCDLTTSMYPYSTQIFAWFRHNSKQPNVKAVVFFTDCDSSGRETQPLSKAGQMYVSTSLAPEKVLPLMLLAARNTVGNGNSEENDIEALLFAQQNFPEARHLVLLADNSSAVKDMALLKQITKPVHVILCGNAADSSQAFGPDYREIALQTKGSLHTIEDDVNPGQELKQPWIRVGEQFYKYDARKKQYTLTRFRYRPRRILGLFWW